MSQELNEKLQNGRNPARQLVEHLLHEMGASSCTIPVIYNDEQYDVSIRHVPVKPESIS